MELHHNRHLQTYIDNLNATLKNYPKLQQLSLEQLILTAPKLPAAVGVPIARNAGGVYNHRFFFNGMTPDAQPPTGELALAINRTFGSLDGFKTQFTQAALSVFGSGYAWLTANRLKKLQIITTANQDTPLTMGLRPIITIDVWEHAYYLKHYNVRAAYVGDWWSVVRWPEAI